MTAGAMPEPDAPPSASERSGEDTGNALVGRLRLLAQLLPPGAAVTLTGAALEALVVTESNDLPAEDLGPDLSVNEAAKALRLSPNRVRALIAEGSLVGYRPAGRGHWHITQAAVAAFRQPVVAAVDPHPCRAPRVDVGRWRRSIGGA